MAEKRACPLCGEPLEDPPAVHDVVACEKKELLKGRATISQLQKSVAAWKDAWFQMREIVGEMAWTHYSHVCPHVLRPVQEATPNPWLHPGEKVVQEGKLVYTRLPAGYKLVGAGASEEAGTAIARLMAIGEDNGSQSAE